LVWACLLAGGVLQGGCFSMAKAFGRNGSPSRGEKTAALAADVATLPVQLAAVGGVVVYQGLVEATGKNRGPSASPRLVARIKADPEVIFREKWHEKPWTSVEQRSIGSALLDPAVPFTESQLRRLLPAFTGREYYVVQCARCPEGFLRELFAEARRERGVRGSLLISGLADNPTTPRDILEAIVSAAPGEYDRAAVIRAGARLAGRKPAAGE
jgi:hypothetical protein